MPVCGPPTGEMETEGLLVPLGSFSVWIGELQVHCVLSETKMKSNWERLRPSHSCAVSHTHSAMSFCVLSSQYSGGRGRKSWNWRPSQVCSRFEASWATWGLVNKTNRAGDIGNLVDCSSSLHRALVWDLVLQTLAAVCLALGRWSHEDQTFKLTLSYIRKPALSQEKKKR